MDGTDFISQLFACPASLEIRLNRNLKEEDVVGASNAFIQCYTEWMMFGETFLKLSHGTLESINQDHDRHESKIRAMFFEWKRQKQESATPRELIEVFEKARLKGIKQLWFANYNPDKKKDDFFAKRNQYFGEIAQSGISVEHWTQILIKLQMQDMENFSERPNLNITRQRLDILHMWENRFGFIEASVEKLKASIKDVIGPDGTGTPLRCLTNQEYSQRRPFVLRKTWGTQIKVCQGCRQKIECKPGEMAVAHYEKATFKIEGKPVTELTNCHYHLDLDCIMIKWSNYDGSLWATEWELEDQEMYRVIMRGFNIVKSK
uniref:Death domain-containing protein n=1 Tax=Ciona savignyi TaxID=51511 RepID=H2ZNS1_CIOSA